MVEYRFPRVEVIKPDWHCKMCHKNMKDTDIIHAIVQDNKFYGDICDMCFIEHDDDTIKFFFNLDMSKELEW